MATEEDELQELRTKLGQLLADNAKYKREAAEREAAPQRLQERLDELAAQAVVQKQELRNAWIEHELFDLAPRFGVLDRSAARKLLDPKHLEFDQDDKPTPTSLAAALDSAIVAHPFLLGPTERQS